ncbi:MAG: HAMP domain-containing histidine kinase [Oscillospiraceae bacterium]|nr:HAMP domain-containing histidine kinase [Oscillospiraceae bacterium]
MAIVFIVVIAYSVSIYVYYYNNMQDNLVSKARTTTDFFSNYLGQSYNEFYQSCVTFAQTFEDSNRMELQFIKTSGRLVASSYGQWSGQAPGTPEIQQAVSTQQIQTYIGSDPDTGERIMAVSSPMIYTNGDVIGILRYVTSLQPVDREILKNALFAIAVGVALIAMILLISRYFISTIVRPVTEITATAKRIANGSYGVQIPKQFDDEIGELVDTINDMSTKIAQTEKMQSEFISSVSHELRTPLTAISGWGETLLADGGDPEENRKGIQIILRETHRLIGMVEELLEFTRIQDGRFTLNVRTCDIRSEFEDTVFMYGSRLRQEGIELEYLENDSDIPEIPCDAERLRQVFLNILDNAVKHGGTGKKITAEILRQEQEILIRIRDFGPGIPEAELPYVKQKFYKGSSKARGSGIGLAVCDEIVTLHNGKLEIANAEGGGTCVSIRLPIEES